MKKIIIGTIAGTLLISGCKKNESTATQTTEPATQVQTQTKAPKKTTSQVGPTFIAFGNEPSWQVKVMGTEILYTTPENPAGIRVNSERQRVGQTIQFSSEVDGENFVIAIARSKCADSMSGEEFILTATLFKGGNTYGGCGKRQ